MLRRTLILALVLATLAPPAAANQAPTAIASAQAEAVLGEPVVFTSLSTDPDGMIVSHIWTDTDGRDLHGAVITRAFDFPGVHTMSLRVTDDAGAMAFTEIQVLVHATLLHGRAYALQTPSGTRADTGDVVTPYHTETTASEGEVRNGGLKIAALDAKLRTLNERAIARADAAFVHVPIPIGSIRITGIEAEAFVSCTGTTLAARFTQIRLNDAPIVPPGEVPPNTRVAIPGGGEIVLNAQETVAPDRVSVTAARVLLPGQAPIEIAHAEAGVTHCPFASA